MWKSKKAILGALLVVCILVGSTVAVALAQTSNGDERQPKARYEALLDKVAEIYQKNTGVAIDPQQLKDAFDQAQGEMRAEALDSYLQNLVDQGKITQEQAEQYKEWSQAKPDMEQFRQQLKGWQQARPGIPPELKEWQEARPDIPPPGPFGRGFGGRGFPGGMKWGGGRLGPCW